MAPIQEIVDDIWHLHELEYLIVIPTNLTLRKNGECVMGRGLALQAAQRFPNLPKKLGTVILNIGNVVHIFEEERLISFPVKNDWRGNASLELIENSCLQLVALASANDLRGPIFIPRVGTGYGRLDWQEVKPILEKYLDNRFIICNY